MRRLKRLLQYLFARRLPPASRFPSELDWQKAHLELLFRLRLGRQLSWAAPKTFNEKMQVLKLLQTVNPSMTQMSDKLAVRGIVEEKGYASHLIPLLGHFTTFAAFKKARPGLHGRVVIKPSHWSGRTVFAEEASAAPLSEVKRLFPLLKKDYFDRKTLITIGKASYLVNKGESNYRHMRGEVVVERDISVGGKLEDFKIFCFGGEPVYIEIDVDRFTKHTRCFYDIRWVKQPFSTEYPLFGGEVEKPECLPQMLEFARVFAKGWPFLRVDLYSPTGKQFYFGEFTFYHGSGTERFTPDEWEAKLGDLIRLER